MTHLTTCALTRKARRLTHDSQAMHRTLAHIAHGHHLWGLPDAHTLVIQHDKPIHWPGVMPGVIDRTHTIETTTPITGAPIEWAIIANPTKARSQGPEKRGKVTPLEPGLWKKWIERKTAGAINIHDVDATPLPTARGQRHTAVVTHRRVLFNGTGTVANHDLLAALQNEGIGRGKAYGCGLLIIQEAS